MRIILKPYPIVFTKKSILKTLLVEGLIPLKKGMYGGELSREPNNLNSVTLEHIQPHSKGGSSSLANYALVTAKNNQSRSDQPLWKVFNKEAFDEYCESFKDLEIPYESGIFKGNSYVEGITKTVTKELKKSGHLDLLV